MPRDPQALCSNSLSAVPSYVYSSSARVESSPHVPQTFRLVYTSPVHLQVIWVTFQALECWRAPGALSSARWPLSFLQSSPAEPRPALEYRQTNALPGSYRISSIRSSATRAHCFTSAAPECDSPRGPQPDSQAPTPDAADVMRYIVVHRQPVSSSVMICLPSAAKRFASRFTR